MQAERVSRHFGIERESMFALCMFRWANHIMQFVDLSRKLDKIGIKEIEDKMADYREKRQVIQKVVMRMELFARVRQNRALLEEVEVMSQHMSGFGSEESHFETQCLAEREFESDQEGPDEEETKEEQIDVE
jgi:hypothetical protein